MKADSTVTHDGALMSSLDVVVTPPARAQAIAASRPCRSLADLAVGEAVTVRKLRCERPVARRLMELGLLPGTLVTLRRVAPLGDPLELRLRGYSLSIRRSEAAWIDVDPPALGTVDSPGQPHLR